MEKYEVIKFKDNELEVDVRISPFENTVWLTQKQMVELFLVSKATISEHINNIIKEKELVYDSVVRDFRITASDGKSYRTKIYNLDMIISIGYRVKSKRGIIFRIWANQVLKQYLLNGYVINENRTLVTNENYIRLINKVESLDDRVSVIEKHYKPEEYINSKILFNGQFYYAYTFV